MSLNHIKFDQFSKESIFNYLKDRGLEHDGTTGGFFSDHMTRFGVHITYSGRYVIEGNKMPQVIFMSANAYLKTVAKVEDHLGCTLFNLKS